MGANQGKSYDPQVVIAHTTFMGDTGWLTYRKSPSQSLTGTCPKAERKLGYYSEGNLERDQRVGEGTYVLAAQGTSGLES